MLLNYRRFATFAGQGGLEPLGNYLAQSTLLDEADFYEAVIEAFRFAGQLWCIPQNMSSLVVYYNQELFDAAACPIPADDWTWGDFLSAAQQLTIDLDGDGRPDQYGAGIEPTLNRLAPFIWQAGGELVDDPQTPPGWRWTAQPPRWVCSGLSTCKPSTGWYRRDGAERREQ
jgi:multiple sugar transport system substrate-binding protein